MLEDSARPVPVQRALAGTVVPLGFGYVDHEGIPAPFPQAPTIAAATNLAGASVTTASPAETTASGDRQAYWSSSITAANVGNDPDLITVTWDVNGAQFTRLVEIVGRHLFTIGDVRSTRLGQDRSKVSDDRIRWARFIVDAEFDRVLRGRSMVPRARKVTVTVPPSGGDCVFLPDWDIRSIRSVVTTTPSGTETTYTTAQRAALHANVAGVVERLDSSSWPSTGTITFVYEYGFDGPPADVVQAAMRRLEFWLAEEKAVLPSFATGYTMPDTGALFRFSSAMDTGDMLVDRILENYARRIVPIA